MQFSPSISTTGKGSLPVSIGNVAQALTALQLMGHRERTSRWYVVWECLWTARETRAPEDIEGAAHQLRELLRARHMLAEDRS